MNAERMNMANATAKIEGSKEARPPGGFPLASAPKKIFICSPYRPTANDAPYRKAQLEANIQRAKTTCRILATMGVLPFPEQRLISFQIQEALPIENGRVLDGTVSPTFALCQAEGSPSQDNPTPEEKADSGAV